MKRSLVLLMVIAMMVSLIAGCASAPAPNAETSAAVENVTTAPAETTTEPSKPIKVGVFIASNVNEFTQSVGNGALKQGKDLGIDVTVFDGHYDQANQINQIETCINEGYQGLIIEPCTLDGVDNVVKEAQDAGIKVITVIQRLRNQDLVSSFVGADTRAAAKMQMEACMESIGGKGKIAILEGTAGSTDATIIRESFNEVLANFPNVEVVEIQDCGWTIDKAIATTETWLQKHSDITAFVAHNGDMALGAIKACQDAGLKTGPGGIFVSGRDAVSDELKYVKEGIENQTIWQGGPDMGATALDVVLKLINGETVEKEYITENVVVSKDNADEYIKLKEELKALFG